MGFRNSVHRDLCCLLGLRPSEFISCPLWDSHQRIFIIDGGHPQWRLNERLSVGWPHHCWYGWTKTLTYRNMFICENSTVGQLVSECASYKRNKRTDERQRHYFQNLGSWKSGTEWRTEHGKVSSVWPEGGREFTGVVYKWCWDTVETRDMICRWNHCLDVVTVTVQGFEGVEALPEYNRHLWWKNAA